jgi:hypothetical protein
MSRGGSVVTVYLGMKQANSTCEKAGQRCGMQNKMFMQPSPCLTEGATRRLKAMQAGVGRRAPEARVYSAGHGETHSAAVASGLQLFSCPRRFVADPFAVRNDMYRPITSCSTVSSFLKSWNVPPVALRPGSIYRRVIVASTWRESELVERHSI